MRFDTVKSADQITLRGISVELDIVGGSLKGATLRDASGSMARFTLRNWNDFTIEVPAAPKMVKRHRMQAEVLGVATVELFEHSHQAHERLRAFEAIGTPEPLPPTKTIAADDVPF
jgi:hypothetical protein